MFCLWCVEPKTSPKEDILDQSEPMTKSAMESSNQPSKNVSLNYAGYKGPFDVVMRFSTSKCNTHLGKCINGPLALIL